MSQALGVGPIDRSLAGSQLGTLFRIAQYSGLVGQLQKEVFACKECMDRYKTSNKDAQVDYLSDYLRLMQGCGLLMEISARESENLRMQFLVCSVRKSAMFHPIVGGEIMQT